MSITNNISYTFIYLRTKFQMRTFIGSLLITVKLKAKRIFRTIAMLLF
jgi:hypothetical protein